MGKVGFSRVVITPPIGTYMGGYTRNKPSQGVHDDLHSTALYVEANNAELLLISVDLVSLYKSSTSRIRKMIHNATGIPYNSIMIHATHTHSGFDTLGIVTFTGAFIKPTIEKDVLREIEEKIATSGINATENATEGRVGFAQKCPEERIVVNRRDPKKDVTYPISVIRFDRRDGEHIILAHYTCHGTCLPRTNYLYSSDYVGYLINYIERKFPNTKGIYFNGPCGDINPFLVPPHKDPSTLSAYEIYNWPGNFKKAKEIGEKIAKVAIEVATEINCSEILEIGSIREDLSLPLSYRTIRRGIIPALTRLGYFVKSRVVRWLYMRRAGNWVYTSLTPDGLAKTEIFACKINNILIGGIPGEAFQQIGKDINAKSPSRATIVVENVNDYIGYIPHYSELGTLTYEELMCFVPLASFVVPRRILAAFSQLSK